jgi:hypothetical protein
MFNEYIVNIKCEYSEILSQIKNLEKCNFDKDTEIYVAGRISLFISEINITDGMVNKKKIMIKMNNFILENLRIVSEFNDTWHKTYITKIINVKHIWGIMGKILIKYVKYLKSHLGEANIDDILYDILDNINEYNSKNDNHSDNDIYLENEINKLISLI